MHTPVGATEARDVTLDAEMTLAFQRFTAENAHRWIVARGRHSAPSGFANVSAISRSFVRGRRVEAMARGAAHGRAAELVYRASVMTARLRLAELVAARGMTHSELSHRSGLPQPTITRQCTNRPKVASVRALDKLAAFGGFRRFHVRDGEGYRIDWPYARA